MELSYIVGLIVGVPLAIAGVLGFLKKLKINGMMRDKKRALLELADSWPDTPIREFDPTEVLTDEVFKDLQGFLFTLLCMLLSTLMKRCSKYDYPVIR